MSSSLKNLSSYGSTLPNAKKFRFGIVVSEWNSAITEAMYEGAIEILSKAGADKKNITRITVPGSFELTRGAQLLASAKKKPDAIICIGCVIKGETPHFDFICQAVAYGLTQTGLMYELPVIFGVLTTNTLEQAQARSGGKHGNKGVEAAVTALRMAALKA